MIPDQECVDMVYRLLYEEGLFVGSSTGINVAAAVRVARDMGPGKCIVTILCDSGSRYQSRLFNADWLRGKGLAMPGRRSGKRKADARESATRRRTNP